MMSPQPQLGVGPDYLQPLPQTDWGNNPWSAAATADATIAQTGVASGQKNLMQLGSQYQQMAQPEQYPSFPNSMGLGSQQAFGQASPAPQMQAQGTPDISPWTFQGSALAR